jgi:hypothetical protein
LNVPTPLAIAVKMPLPFQSVGGFLVHGFFDQARQQLFAANPSLNELDVISGADLSIKARIPVPDGWGVDQMADGKTLVVGTKAQQIYTVDEDTFAVTPHLCPLTWGGFPFDGVVYPNPVAMANGKVLLIGQIEGQESNNISDGGQFVIEWDSNTNAFKQLEPSGTDPLWETDSLARSADHKWAAFSGDNQLFLYSSDTDSLTSAPGTTVNPPTGDIRGYAVNADGSKIAVVSADQITFVDRSFNVLGTAPIPPAYADSGRAQFSAGGNRVFLYYGINTGTQGIWTVDADAITSLGYYSESVWPLIANISFLGSDSNDRVFFGNGNGVRVTDTTGTPIPPNPAGALPGYSCVIPDTNFFPLNTPTQTGFGYFDSGAKLYIGGYLATLSPDGTQIQIPASATVGPVDFECIGSDGQTSVEPAAISYGVQPIASSANLLPNTGQPQIYLYGYGMLDKTFHATPTVTVGGASAAVVSTNANLNLGSLQGAAIGVPGGAQGSASITVTSANGTGTLSNQVSYISSTTIIPASGLLQLVFDTHRSLLYALKAQEIDVLDPSTLQWRAPLPLPAIVTGHPFADMALSPDGSKIAIATGDSNLVVLDPDHAAGASLLNCTSTNYGGTISVGISQSNTAFLSSSCDGAIDLNTRAVVHGPFGVRLIRSSADGSRIYGVDDIGSDGTVSAIDPSTFSVQSQSFAQQFWTDIAVAPDGSSFSAVFAPPFANGDAIGFFDPALHLMYTNAYPSLSPPSDTGVIGPLFSPQGKVVIVPLGNSIEFWDAAHGTLRARLMTPERLQVLVYPETSAAGAIAYDAAGQTVYALSASGLSVLKLPAPVDQVAPATWPFAVRARAGNR